MLSPTSVGLRLRHAREFRGVTQQEMATFLGISKRHLIRYEKDDVIPSLATVERMSAVLKVNSNWIVKEIGSMTAEVYAGKMTLPEVSLDKQVPQKSPEISEEVAIRIGGIDLTFVKVGDSMVMSSRRPLEVEPYRGSFRIKYAD